MEVLGSGRLARARLALAIVVTDALYFWLMFVPQMRQIGWNINAFKNYYSSDQISYLAIAANWAHGYTAGTEPFTETGHNYYPHLYYICIGLMARIFGLTPTAAWNVMAFVVQIAFISFLGWLIARVTRTSWGALAALVPITAGTLGSNWIAAGNLWGPFGMIASNNGEVAGLMLAIACLAYLFLRSVRTEPSGAVSRDRVLPAVCGFCFGLLGEIHTYAFIDTTYVLIYGIAAWGIAVGTERRLRVTAASAGLLVVSVPIADGVSQLSALAAIVVGLLAALPGVVLAVRRIGWRRVVVPAGLFVLAALPQVIVSLSAALSHDPFMTYRQASSGAQSLPLMTAINASVVGLIALASVALVGLVLRQRVVTALALGLALAWLILTKNDFFWGSGQEPYRQWIDTNFLVLGLSTVALAYYARPVLSIWSAVLREPRSLWVPFAELSLTAVLALAITYGLSTHAVLLQRQAIANGPALLTQTPQFAAIKRVIKHTDGLVLADPCIDPEMLKVVTDARVVYYNQGMAWPARYNTITQLVLMHLGQPFSLSTIRHSGIAAVLTWTGCKNGWSRREAAGHSRLLASAPVSTGGRMDLWSATLRK